MTDLVLTERHGSVCTITLADQEHRNALGNDLVNELTVAIDGAEADPGIRVIVLTNRGRVFCAGADLSTASAAAPRALQRPQDLFGRFRRSSKLYVGRIAGHCVAGGMGLAAGMDIAVAADDVKFGFTEVRVGVAPAVISVVCLPNMRPVDARAAFLRGHRFTAAEAARMGLISAAVPRDCLDGEIAAVVADLLAGGPLALAATKRLLADVPTMSAEAAFEWTAGLSADLFRSEEAKEGMAAFCEKRLPAWLQRPP